MIRRISWGRLALATMAQSLQKLLLKMRKKRVTTSMFPLGTRPSFMRLERHCSGGKSQKQGTWKFVDRPRVGVKHAMIRCARRADKLQTQV